MELIIAETAGFCMGVDMALHKLDNAVSIPPQDAQHIYTLGPIIHNPQVLARYKGLGVLQTDGTKPLQTGDVVVIRAHGIPRHIQTSLEGQNITVVDATCPKVKKDSDPHSKNKPTRINTCFFSESAITPKCKAW